LGKSRIAIQVLSHVVMWEVACESLDGLGWRLWERSWGDGVGVPGDRSVASVCRSLLTMLGIRFVASREDPWFIFRVIVASQA